MTPVDLRTLALAARDHPIATFGLEGNNWDTYIAACSPDAILALLDELDRFYDFVNGADPAIVDAYLFTENNRDRGHIPAYRSALDADRARIAALEEALLNSIVLAAVATAFCQPGCGSSSDEPGR